MSLVIRYQQHYICLNIVLGLTRSWSRQLTQRNYSSTHPSFKGTDPVIPVAIEIPATEIPDSHLLNIIISNVMGLVENFIVLLVAPLDPVVAVVSHLHLEEEHHQVSRDVVTLIKESPASTAEGTQNHQVEKVGIFHPVHPLLIPVTIKQPVVGQEILLLVHRPV